MIYSYDGLFMPVFRARHYMTDGRVENVIEALNAIGQEWVALCLAQGVAGEAEQPVEYWQGPVALACRAAARLKRRTVYADMILPGAGLLAGPADEAERFVRTIYAQAVDSQADTVWVDDSWGGGVAGDRASLLAFYRGIVRVAEKMGRRTRLGLIAGDPARYRSAGLTMYEAADALAGDFVPLLAVAQPMGQDYDRTAILRAAGRLAAVQAELPADREYEMAGLIWESDPSGFHRSGESMQMQLNLNSLMGARGGMFDLFGSMGMAAGEDNLYLKMVGKNKKRVNKLSSLLGGAPQSQGVAIVVDDEDGGAAAQGWSGLLWRMGVPVRLIRPEGIDPAAMVDTVFILTGSTPARLAAGQLDALFHYGVLLDVAAAATIQNTLKRPELLGVRVGGRLTGVATESFSDHGFATPFYGHETLMHGRVEPGAFRRLTVQDPQARAITTLIPMNRSGNEPGIVLFDNVAGLQRCAVLPWNLTDKMAQVLLTVVRQRHLREILAWLLRKRLPCVVENTPDLVPFLVRTAGKKRLILALLNVSFDWAVQARIRLAGLPFTVKRVRYLTEAGRLEEQAGLALQTKVNYQYIELEENTAVPPMQMTVLVLEG